MSDATSTRSAAPTPRGTLSRHVIAEAGLEVGISNLSVSAVARHLGVTHGALYRHVDNAEDLGRAVSDLAVASVDWPPDDTTWQGFVLEAGTAMHSVFVRNPGIADLAGGEEAYRRIGDTLMCLVRHGFRFDDAVLAVEMLFHLVRDSARTPDAPADSDDPVLSSIAKVQPTPFETKLEVLVLGLEARFAPRRAE